MGFTNPFNRRTLALVVVAAVTGSVLIAAQPAFADTAPITPTPETVSSDALPTVQINGVVWDQAIVGNTVYAVGEFTSAQAAGLASGVGTVPRSNMLSYSLTTGQLITSFAPTFNGRISSITATPDGSKIFVAGYFTSVNGSTRYRLAGFDTATGALLPFAPSINSAVDTVEATNSTVYFGGNFSIVQGQSRNRAASVSIANAAVSTFAPVAEGGRVRAIAISPDQSKIILGGAFTTLNGPGASGYGLGAVTAATGASLPWAANESIVRNGGQDAAIYSLTSDGDSVYGTGYAFGAGGTLEGAFRADWSDGAVKWVESCHGDSYSVAAQGNAIYVASHAHYCGNNGGFPQTDPWTYQRGMAWSKDVKGVNLRDPLGYHNFEGTPSPELLNWWPDINSGSFTGANQGAWSVVANDKYVLYAGEFTIVNNKRQQGLVRFATKDIAPNKDAPRLSGPNFVPNAVSLSAGSVRLSWLANYDRDNQYLTYDLIRDNVQATPIYTVVKGSRIWFDRPSMGFVDKGLVPGQTYSYRLRVSDPMGNTFLGNSVKVTVSTDGISSAYGDAVIADGSSYFWRLGESGGSTAYDWAGFDDGVASAGVTRGASGAINGDPNSGSTFSGGNDGFVSSQSAIQGPNTFSIEAWFKTTTTAGGKIVGFGNSKTGNSNSYDRHVYMENDGKVTFGLYPGGIRTISSPAGLNDGQWHQVVATLGSQGMQLFVDGLAVAQRSDVTTGQDYTGYWRIGGDSSWAASNYFAGDIDDVAIYPTALSPITVNDHLVKSGRASALPEAPADSYGARIFADNPDIYWRLGESTGTIAVDTTGGDPGLYLGGVTQGSASAIAGTSNTSAAFDGNSGLVSSTESYSNPQTFSTELWFNSTTTRGGKLIGFGSNQTGQSGSYDRHTYLDDNGHLVFGIYDGNLRYVVSPNTYTDGAWHQVVSTMSSTGISLYVDGELVGSDTANQAQQYDGYWRVGGDTTWGSTSSYVDARIDEVAVYRTALSAADVRSHFESGRGIAANSAPVASFLPATTGLDLSVDAAASTDSDGTIAGYQWAFGDGATSSGATASHTYAAAGNYTVTLTVTDDKGATGTTTRDITLVAANVSPTAAFTSAASNLTASLDASSSTDSDGDIQSFAWNFGDSTTGAGKTVDHIYAAAGTYTVALTVTDNAGASSTVSQAVTVTKAANAVPVAAIQATMANLALTADGSGSTDPDGAISAYAWAFGDGTSAIGPQVTHNYAGPGSFVVTLTVTDDAGATSSTTSTVTATAAPSNSPLASDGFGRAVSGGLGNADIGGAWSVSGGSSSFSVSDGVGSLRSSGRGANLAAYLPAVSSSDTDFQVTAQLKQASTGGGVFVGAIARRVGSSEYRARVVLAANGSATLQAQRNGSTLDATNVSGMTVAVGDQLRIRVQAFGTSPTTIRAKVWKLGTTEPATWQVSAVDSTPSLQQAGSVGVLTYLSGSATIAPLTVSFDELSATSTTGSPVTPPANVAPVAAFASQESGLSSSVDATGSSDPDGTIAGYSWSFGDGGTATGVTASHQFAVAGTFPVTLTVTDNSGAVTSVTKQISVTGAVVDPPVVTPAIAADAFERNEASSIGSAETGGAWSTTGSSPLYSVSGGQGVFSATKSGSTASAYLNAVSAASTDTTVNVSVDQAATGAGTYVMVTGRKIASAEYRARVVFNASGSVVLQVQQGSTTLKAVVVPGMTYVPGEILKVRLQVFGASPTTIRAKVWRDGTTEPADWQVSATDSAAVLQAAGSVGLGTYVSGSATAIPVTVRFDNFSVVTVQ